jgi:16S rRNA (guanine966-N2)-methyltransferase
MRVIAGKYRHRKLERVLSSNTRETKDRVKEALFNSINHKINQAVVCDLFCGSGSLGIEALSRGAKMCYFVDTSVEAQAVLRHNLTMIEEDYQVDSIDAFEIINHIADIDIILVDPPYNLYSDSYLIDSLLTSKAVKDNTLIIFLTDHEVIHKNVIKSKGYGKTYLTYMEV